MIIAALTGLALIAARLLAFRPAPRSRPVPVRVTHDRRP